MSALTTINNTQIILAKTTSAETSSAIGLSQDMSSVTFVCAGLATSETAVVQIWDAISSAYVNYIPPAGIVEMTASINTVTINQTWGAFIVKKSITAAEVGVTANQYFTGV
jgi:hypothetical protein